MFQRFHVPVKCPFSKRVKKPDKKDGHKQDHSKECTSSQIPKSDSPRVDENDLKVEHNKLHGYQIEGDGVAIFRLSNGVHATLIGVQFGFIRTIWTDNSGERHEHKGQNQSNAEEDKNRDVG